MGSEHRWAERSSHNWAERFSRDVDILLRASGRVEDQTPPPDYAETLDLAHIMVTTDWSEESCLRETTRQQLLAGKIEKAPHRSWHWPRFLMLRRRRAALLMVPMIALALILVPLAWPGALTASAQGIETMVHRIVLRRPLTVRFIAVRESPHSNAVASVSQGAPSYIEVRGMVVPPVTFISEPGDIWTMDTPIGEFQGIAPPGDEATIKEYTSLEEIESDWGHLHQPDYLPEDFVFRKARMAPQDSVYVYYAGPHSELIVAQARLEHSLEGTRLPSRAFATVTRKRIEWVPMGSAGEMARWIEGHGLIWEKNGMSYLVGGPDLSLSEAERIAVSLR